MTRNTLPKRMMGYADPVKLARTEPFKAAAWLGAAACAEKVKWAAELWKREALQSAMAELTARIALLETGKLPADCQPAFSLLALTANPEAEAVVEYRAAQGPVDGATQSSVTFYCGGLPLTSAWVREFADANLARKAFDAEEEDPFWQTWWTRPKREHFTLAGLPAYAKLSLGWPKPSELSAFDPAVQVLVCSFEAGWVVILDADAIDHATVGAVTISPSAPNPIGKTVEQWAQRLEKPMLDFQNAAKNRWFLAVGLPARQEDLERLRQVKQVLRASAKVTSHGTTVLQGSRIISPYGNTREINEALVSLIKAGALVSVKDADALHQAVVSALPKPAVAAPKPVAEMSLYSGDVHVHTCFSDGSSTPVGMALQAMYCGMDFVVITDHGTLAGAQVADKLFRACGIRFPVVIGEEVTTAWAHLNAYPLRDVIPADLSPHDTIRAAHVQGAVIQWNHPGGYDRDWYAEHGPTAMRGTGLDAWEHLPPEYDEWKEKGGLPRLVGSTDTHGGMYGASERTLILAPSPAPENVAEAIRREGSLLLSSHERRLFFGRDELIARAVAAIAEAPAMRRQRAARITAALENADLPALLRQGPGGIVKPADVKP